MNTALLAAAIGTPSYSSHALDIDARTEEYLAYAANAGFGRDEAENVLRKVVQEAGGWLAPGRDLLAVARRRLLEEHFDPDIARWRDTARGLCAASGYSTHPAHVDDVARALRQMCQPWLASLSPAPRVPGAARNSATTSRKHPTGWAAPSGCRSSPTRSRVAAGWRTATRAPARAAESRPRRRPEPPETGRELVKWGP